LTLLYEYLFLIVREDVYYDRLESIAFTTYSILSFKK